MTRAERIEARELVELLGPLAAKAIRLGLVKTGRRLDMAAREVGWELAKLERELDKEMTDANH